MTDDAAQQLDNLIRFSLKCTRVRRMANISIVVFIVFLVICSGAIADAKAGAWDSVVPTLFGYFTTLRAAYVVLGILVAISRVAGWLEYTWSGRKYRQLPIDA